jgi:hypothetical protein
MGRKASYPWTKWFRKRRFRLLRGRDYICSTHGMAAMIRNKAGTPAYRLEVAIRILNPDCIDVRVEGSLDNGTSARTASPA